MKPLEIKDKIYWVGAVDWNIRDFHGYSTYKGTTYNSYLMLDDKVTLFDTVKKGFTSDLIHRLRAVIEPEKVDYLVVNHMEMDHSGSLPEIVSLCRPEKVFVSPQGQKALKLHFNDPDWPLEVVKSGDSISVGQRHIHFLETRMLHWPDSMFSYIPEEKLLISSDAFGHHWATSERFDDEVDTSELMHHAAKYYGNILLLFSPLVQKLLAAVKEMGLEIDMIAPDHGVVWRKNPGMIIEAYDRWSRQETERRALVIYDTMWKSTSMMAKAVYEGITDLGVSAELLSLESTHRSDVVTELMYSKGLVIGSPTFNNHLLPRVADLLYYLKGLRPTNRVAAAFGSYGWSGEAVKQINQFFEDMKMEVVDPGVRINFVPNHEGLKLCRELGAKVAQAVIDRT